MSRSVFRALIAMGTLTMALARTASAHPMPKSLVLLDLGAGGVHAELRLPLDRLEIGFGQPLLTNATARVDQLRENLRTYVATHISATSPDGKTWRTTVGDITLDNEKPAHVLIVQVNIDAPQGESPRVFTLHYDVIQHQLLTHVALVSLRHDWSNGAVDAAPEMLGAMGYLHETLDINRPAGSTMRGFTSMIRLGTRHIAEGTDHLLFLLVLLLPATLIARAGRWRGYAGAKQSAMHLLGIVTAFTIGHSITLAIGATGWLRAPSAVVETLIAVSILVSAIHAVRPLFPGKEAFIAGAFGLVHGMAFSTVVAELGIRGWELALAVFGFNVGIELMQLAVVAITVPWLMLLARTGVYTGLRVGGAAVAGVASLGWIGERALGWPNPMEPMVEWGATHALLIVGAIAIVALVATALQRGKSVTLQTTNALRSGLS